ncbi:lysis system i-spanin subunit Rz, partial [Leuconostoc mesenteroides]
MAYQPTDWEHGDIITGGKLNKIEEELTHVSDNAIYGFGGAQLSSDGLTPFSYINAGDPMPANPQKGDTVFLKDGNDFLIYSYNGEDWVLKFDPDLSNRIEETIKTASDNTDKAIADNNTQINETINQVAKSQADLAVKDSDFNNKAQAMANKALSDAKANTAQVAQETLYSAYKHLDDAKTDLTNSIASEASQAVAAANSQAQTYANQAKADALNTIAKEVTDRQNAVSALDSKATNAVNQAKSDINDTINALAVGGRNLLLNSKVLSWGITNNAATTSAEVSYDSTTNMWHITSPKGGSEYAGIYFFQPGNVSNIITKGQQWAFSIDIKGTGVYSKFGIEWSEPFNTPSGNVSTDWTRVSSTGTASGTNAIIIYFNSKDVALDVYIKLPKLEKGTIATDWTPAPEDVVLDYTTKDNKIKETITQYKETNDGHVSKLQTDVSTALGQIETKISQTDYDKKTGELSSHINDVKDTADKSLKAIADIQKADGKQNDRMAEIEHTAGEIKTTVSDLKTAQEKQSGYISTLQQKADGFEATVTKVDNLSVG